MQSKLALTVVIFFWILTVNANTANQQTIQDWLEKMAQASHMQTFSGTFIYGKNSDLAVMNIYHRADKFGEIEKLISMDGSGREVIRSNDLVTCVLPDRNSVVVEKSRPLSKFPPSFPTQIDKLNYYSFSLQQQVNVAGHLSQKISVIPKDAYRFGYLLWLDVKTGLLLKSHLMGEDNKMVEQFLFTNLKYHKSLDDKLFQPSTDGKKYTWHQAKKSLNKKPELFDKWSFDKLPPGFKVSIKRGHTMPRGGKPLKHFVVSDGLATVSVYIENHSSEKSDLLGGTSMGAVNAYGKELDEFHITAVGEVPMVAVRMICESAQFTKVK
ncbi:Sigma factor RpoE negative regulatory protein RseB precursor [hydrothermal vent metagenome]|uniref:Sigma factor RpoE negative regulatory protein RseB n=1 Tax=hydrothermal vent metagenome TaxID=652676 RepID=A0A3B0ZPD5_9ZZZZ